MSLVEAAIKKIQTSGTQTSLNQPLPGANQLQSPAGVQAPPARRGRAPAQKTQVDPKTVRQFKRVPIDSEAMERNCILPQVSDQSALRAYKILRTRLLQKLTANQWNTLAVTGTETGQGKTLTSINLAIALAQDPSTYVFLVDLDLQRPQVGAYLGMQFEKGLGEYLAGEAEINEIIYNPGYDRLAVIPNSRSFEHSSEFLAGARMLNLLRVLEDEQPNRIIIFDMPPMLLSDDVLTFAPQVDGVMLVVTEGVTVRGSIERSKELLAEMNLIGVVLNRSTERNDSPYY